MRWSEILYERYEHMPLELERWKDDPDVFITFTDIPKLGINPLPASYNTPTGIYAFPLKQMWRNIRNNTIPFAGDREYVQVFRPRFDIPDVSAYTEHMFNQDMDKLERLYKSRVTQLLNPQSEGRAHISYESCVSHWLLTAYESTPISQFWNVTRNLALTLSTGKITTDKVRAEGASWNAVLRSLGYAGFTDLTGKGIIHVNEPCQAVFFSLGVIQHIATIHNVRKVMAGSTRIEINSWFDLRRAFETSMNAAGSSDLAKRTAAYARKEWGALLNNGISKHFKLVFSVNSFWERDAEFGQFVDTLLKVDYRNLRELAALMLNGYGKRMTEKALVEFVNRVADCPVKDTELFLNTMLSGEMLRFLGKHLPRPSRLSVDDTVIDIIKLAAENSLLAISADPKNGKLSSAAILDLWKQQITNYGSVVGYYIAEDELFAMANDVMGDVKASHPK